MESYTDDGYITKRLYSVMMNDPEHSDANAFDYMNQQVYKYGEKHNKQVQADEEFDELLSDDCGPERTDYLIEQFDFSKYNHQEMVDFIKDIRKLGI